MSKLLTVVALISSISYTSLAFGFDQILPGQLSTKGLVRMSLWYEGLNLQAETTENQDVKMPKISEELDRALSDV
jgi:hypothetical protein